MKNSPVSIDFDNGLPHVRADAYVSASSISLPALDTCEGIAKIIYNQIDNVGRSGREGFIPYRKQFENHWKSLQEKMDTGTEFRGTAVLVTNEKNEPICFDHLFYKSQKGYIIHAFGAAWPKEEKDRSKDKLEIVESQITGAYLGTMESIYQHNQQSDNKIKSVAIPPLGIDIYAVPPEFSAKCAHDAFSKFFDEHPDANIDVIIALHEGRKENNNNLFGKKLQQLLDNPNLESENTIRTKPGKK